ncbi:TRAP transporter small permease [Marinibacterium sp. SX1]|uniref:TRAP transporter small permease n=1 Tax=Marinibacterium sp. SX1 TaxID=3388424 RepID=UPI003D17E371
MTSAVRLLDALSRLLFLLACLLVAAIVCVVTYDVVSRNLGLTTIVWAVNSVEYAMLHITFLCFPWLVRTRGHVCVEIALTMMPAGLRRAWEAMLMVLAAAICFYMAWRSGLSLADTLASGAYEVRSFDMPMWLLYSTMPVGFLVGGLQFLAFFARGESFYGAAPDAHAGL